MTDQRRKRGRLQFILIAALFLGPLAFAAWLYFSGAALQPAGRTNHGALLEPIASLADALPDSGIHDYNDGHWLLVYVDEDACDADCESALYRLRQSRLMLGKEMDRVVRVFLHGETPPDTVFLAEEHAGLVTLSDHPTAEFLDNRKPVDLAGGGLYLVDPLGNLVMYFRPDIDPADMVDDIKRLLDLSRIG